MLPCYVGTWLGARTKTHGFLSVDETGWSLVLHDGRIEDTLLEESTDRIHWRWTDVREVEIKRGRLRHSIVFRVSDPRLLHGVPGADKDRLVLHAQTKHGDLLDRIERRAATLRDGAPDGLQAQGIDQAIDDIRDFLDRI